MKLSDYVFSYLQSAGVTTVFTLTGGGIMHLVDSLGHSNMKYVCCHHEQAAAVAAQAFSMYEEHPAVCLITTGPGGTNALTGLAAAYMDSTPMIFLSGQVKRSDFAALRGVRQYGAQENDIVSMASPVAKYAVTIMEPQDIAYEMEKALFLATSGRKGPVWLDIPLDVQAADIDVKGLRHFSPPKAEMCDKREIACKVLAMLKKAQRPLLLVGHGAVSAKAQEIIKSFVKKYDIPLMVTWRAVGMMADDEENFFGSPGLQAPRYSNIILQHADFLLVLGSRLDNMITAFDEPHFAFRAHKVIVDIDSCELDKLQMGNVLPVHGDVREFMLALQEQAASDNLQPVVSDWCRHCQWLKERYPIYKEKQAETYGVDLYKVTQYISECAAKDDTLVISSTSRCNTAGHIAFNHKEGQRSISSMGFGSMGFALPSAVGAAYANGGKRVIMLEGDGSLQLNIQEFETVAANKLNVKMFIFDNRGYAAITTMQDRNFDGFYVGSNEKSGLFMPSMEKIANAYALPYIEINCEQDIKPVVDKVFAWAGPVICKITGSLYFDEIPKCISHLDKATGKRVSAALENQYPFLDEAEKEAVSRLLLSGEA